MEEYKKHEQTKEIETSKNLGSLDEETKQEIKQPAKAEEHKTEKPDVKHIHLKKDYALVNGNDLHLSPKESQDVCNMIRGRTIDTAIKMVEEVRAHKRVVKMNNREVPHQHGKGVMAGRFPENACKEVARLLKNLKATAIYNELELEKAVISCIANVASKPYKRGGARFKRCHIMIRLDKKKEQKKTENK